MTWCIKWRGLLTRDVGYDYVEAETLDEAKTLWLLEHASTRELQGITARRPHDIDPCGE